MAKDLTTQTNHPDRADQPEQTDQAEQKALAPKAEEIGQEAKLRLLQESQESRRKLELPEPIKNLAIKEQVRISLADNGTGQNPQYILSIKAAGQERELARTSDSSPAALQNQIEKLLRIKQNELARKYKITFAGEGEDVVGKLSFTADGKPVYGAMVHARAAKLAELYELESVMTRANPSNLARNNRQGVKFYFLSDSLYEQDTGAIATYTAQDKDKKPAVYIGTDGITARLVEADGKTVWQGGGDSQVLLHELAHNSQNRTGLDQEKRLLKYAHQCGFYPFNPPHSEETVWALKTKSGALFKLDHETDQWLRIDKTNRFLDKSGKVVANSKEAESMDGFKIREEAAVRPPTLYFDNAVEMGAEGLSMFRDGTENRRLLAKESPQFYAVVKEFDQTDINLAFGKNSQGAPRMLRLPDGTLRQNDGAARKLIRDFEAGILPKELNK